VILRLVSGEVTTRLARGGENESRRARRTAATGREHRRSPFHEATLDGGHLDRLPFPFLPRARRLAHERVSARYEPMMVIVVL